MSWITDIFDQDDIDEALETDEDVLAAKLALAAEACEYWQSIAPIEADPRPDDRPAGTYRDSIHVEQHGNRVLVVTNDVIAHMIEFGTVNMHEFACRARTEAYINGTNFTSTQFDRLKPGAISAKTKRTVKANNAAKVAKASTRSRNAGGQFTKGAG
jgi:hypothetical protein